MRLLPILILTLLHLADPARTAAAPAPQTPDSDSIRCETASDCPADLPVCCGFDPRIQWCLPEGTVC
ncbi:hypothetical protein BDV09DRAFT_159127 [Aspergillus tetrazonus]